MVYLGKSQKFDANRHNNYNYFYNRPMHEQSRHNFYDHNNINNIDKSKPRKIVLVSEKHLFEGLVGGLSFALTSILLFKSGLTTKAFKRIHYDWMEVKVIFGIVFAWIFVWSVRKMSNVIYDNYIAVNTRRKPYEIAISS